MGSKRAAPLEPEIVSPKASIEGLLSDQSLDRLASWLDDGMEVPGTRLRFGVDPLMGLLPGLGDAFAGALSFAFVLAGWKRGLPRVTLLRMLANIVIDSVAGTLPVAGDLFDLFWKSNRRNYNLLRRHAQAPYSSHTWRDWLFLWAVAAIVAAVALLPIAVLAGLVWLLRG